MYVSGGYVNAVMMSFCSDILFLIVFFLLSLMQQGHTNQAFSQMMLGGFGNMKLFDFKPTYFDSDEEAAVYFEHTVRQNLPKV